MTTSTILVSCLAVIAVLTLFVYLLAPVVMYFVFKANRDAKLEIVSPDDATEEGLDALADILDQLEELGFEAVALAKIADFMPVVDMELIVYRHSEDPIAAIAAATYVTMSNKPRKLKQVHAEFASQLENEREIQTSNSKALARNDRINPTHFLIEVPGERDLSRLIKLHKAQLKREPSRPRQIPEGETFVREITQEIVNYIDRAVKSGVMRMEPDGSTARLAMTSAYIMTWREMYPGIWIRKTNAKKRVREIESLAG